MSRQMLGSTSGFVGLAAMLLAPVALVADDAVDLRPKFIPGRVSYIEISSDAQSTIKGSAVPGGPMEIKVSQATGVLEKVASSSKTGVKIVLTYDRRAMTLDYPMMGKLKYDSDMPGDDESPYIKQISAPLIGMSLTMELDKAAHATSFVGMEAVLKKVEASASANPFFGQMKSSLTDEAAKRIWGENRWAVLPDKPVKVGDTWKKRIEIENPRLGPVINDFQCKLDRITESQGNKVAIITYTGKISQPPEEKSKEAAPAPKPKIKEGSLSGTTTFDIQTGQIVKQTQETRMHMTRQSPDGEKTPAMDVQTLSKETTTVQSPAERQKQKKENLAKAKAKAAEAKAAEAKKRP